MKAENVIAICDKQDTNIIEHIKSGKAYFVVGHQKVKIDGEWKQGAMYSTYTVPHAFYWRSYDDFEGFKEIKVNSEVNLLDL